MGRSEAGDEGNGGPHAAEPDAAADNGGDAGVDEVAGKPIRLSGHAASYQQRRGFAPEEVEAAIREGAWQPARANRFEASVDRAFGATWNGKPYATKRIRAVFVDEPDEIVVVTVYTYYF